MKTAVILGAGFSKNSGIPIQAEIPALLVEENMENGFENNVSLVLRKFIRDVFGWGPKNGVLPNLDDIFTCIDISTSSGHHLGIGYTPVRLRAVRRFLVYRVFSLLEKNFSFSPSSAALVKRLGILDTGYVVLNWDTVLEKYIMTQFPGTEADYYAGGVLLDGTEYVKRVKKAGTAKIHGSMNWLYCDNCRTLIYDIFDEVPTIRKAGFQETDTELLDRLDNKTGQWSFTECEICRCCGNPISSHIATFSYRKSFKANSFPSIWDGAEGILSGADRWVFIGYSLPEADYEFKHLLKIAELKLSHVRKSSIRVDVVLQGSDRTIERYKGFFGEKINLICNGGIPEYLNYMDSML